MTALNTLERTTIIIDFDSTFTKVEGLDELAKIALRGNKDRDNIVAKIEEITEKGMAGHIKFAQSLQERVDVIPANKAHLAELVEVLFNEISDSFEKTLYKS